MTNNDIPTWRVAALAAIATFIDGYDLQSLGLAVPLMAPAFHKVPADFSLALTATFIGMFIGAASLAPVADRVGRRSVLVIAMLVVAAGTAGAALVQDLALLAVARTLTGIGVGAAVPVAIALVSEWTSAAYRTTIVTGVVVATGVGAFIAGMSAPLIVARWGWRGIFAVGGVLPAISATLLLLGLPAGRAGLPAITKKQGVASLLRPPYAGRTRLLWIVFPLNLVVTYALIAWLPTLLVSSGWSAADAQRGSGLVAIGGIFGGLCLGWIADRGYAAGALVTAYGIAGISLILIRILPPHAWLVLLLVSGVTSFGAAMTLGSLSAQFYPSELRATGTGWASGIGRLGSIAGPLAVGVALKHHVPGSLVIAGLVIPMAACALATMLLPRPAGDDARLDVPVPTPHAP